MKVTNKEEWEATLMNPKEDPEKITFDELHSNQEQNESDKVLLHNPQLRLHLRLKDDHEHSKGTEQRACNWLWFQKDPIH